MDALPTYFLEVIPPQGGKYILPLAGNDEFVAGRSPNRCRLLLKDPRVSRVHLRVSRAPNHQITVMDLHTANGTILDGRPLPSGLAMMWLINQPVTIGGTTLILRYGP